MSDDPTNIDYAQFAKYGLVEPHLTHIQAFADVLRLLNQDRSLAPVALRAIKAELAARSDPAEQERRGTAPPA